MKTMGKSMLQSMAAILVFTVLCGVIYTGIVTLVAQIAFPYQSNGSMITVDGSNYGSELIGQDFTGEEYLWGRMMKIDTSTYVSADGSPLMYAGPFNLSPASDQLAALVAARTSEIKDADTTAALTSIPVDLITGSGSGLDPYISVEAAEYQAERIARVRGISASAVEKIINAYTVPKLFGFMGENVVNVLKVNLALDGISG